MSQTVRNPYTPACAATFDRRLRSDSGSSRHTKSRSRASVLPCSIGRHSRCMTCRSASLWGDVELRRGEFLGGMSGRSGCAICWSGSNISRRAFGWRFCTALVPTRSPPPPNQGSLTFNFVGAHLWLQTAACWRPYCTVADAKNSKKLLPSVWRTCFSRLTGIWALRPMPWATLVLFTLKLERFSKGIFDFHAPPKNDT